ncbi:hypothetical protein CA51_19720 [Rosistilla oblonga]|nr:hypothetical protein CA51_19720 [Rosistilla oblonga]
MAGGPSRPRSRQVNWGNGPGGRSSIGPSAQKVLKLSRPKPRPMAWAMQMVEPSALIRWQTKGTGTFRRHPPRAEGPAICIAQPAGLGNGRRPVASQVPTGELGQRPGGRASIGPSAQKVLKLSRPKPRPMAWAMQMVEPSALIRRVPDGGKRYGKRKGQAHSANSHCGPKVQQFA